MQPLSPPTDRGSISTQVPKSPWTFFWSANCRRTLQPELEGPAVPSDARSFANTLVSGIASPFRCLYTW